MASQGVLIAMKSKGYEAPRAHRCPAAIFAKGGAGASPTVMEYKGLLAILETLGNTCNKSI